MTRFIAASPYDAYTAPSYWFQINGSPAPDLAQRTLLFRLTEGHLKKKEVDKLELDISDPGFQLDGDPRLESDVRWLVRWGYPHNLSPIRTFVFKFYEPIYDQHGAHTKKLTLHGTGSDLIRVRSARNWGNVQSSDIAYMIAKRHNLKPQINASRDATETPYVQPTSVDDYAYLSGLADDIDFEFFVVNDQLVYRSRDSAYGTDPYDRFVYGSANSLLLSFKPAVKTPSSVNVQARAADTAQGNHPSVQPAVDNSNVGGQHLGTAVVTTTNPADPNSGGQYSTVAQVQASMNQLVDSTTSVAINADTGKNYRTLATPVGDAAAMTKHTAETNANKVGMIATAAKRSFLDNTVEATAEFMGTPRVTPRRTFIIVLPDRRLSGAWYVVESTHTISAAGYSLSAKLHKGAYSDPNANQGNRTNVDKRTASGGSTDGPQRVTLVNAAGNGAALTGIAYNGWVIPDPGGAVSTLFGLTPPTPLLIPPGYFDDVQK